MHIRAAAKIVRFTLDQRTGKFRILDHFARFGDNFLVAGVVICLRDVDMDKFVASVDRSLATFDCRTVVEIEIHLDAVFALVIIDEITHIFEPERFDFTVRHLNEHGRMEFLRRPRDGDERFLIVNIERPYRKMLCSRALHQMACSRRIVSDL